MDMSKVKIPGGHYYSPADAAVAIGVTEGRIRQMIRWGQLTAIRISDRAWIVPETAVQQAIRERDEKK
jgi:hypothetical protein